MVSSHGTFLLLAMFLLLGPATPLFATCDNEMKVYFDGELQPETPDMKNWGKTSQLSIPAGTRVVAIECKDLGAQEGILASTPKGMKTGPSWRCASQLVEDWTQPEFVSPPGVFSPPNILGNNGVRPWGVRLHSMKLIFTKNRTVKTFLQ